MTQPPPVEAITPTRNAKRLFRLTNPAIVAILRSPFHAVLSGIVVLITLRGRRTGNTYTVPVEYHDLDGTITVLTAGAWRHNLRGGAEVRLLLRGELVTAHAELIEDPDEVARTYGTLLRRTGFSKARRLGMKMRERRMPIHAELVEALGGRRAVVRLTQEP